MGRAFARPLILPWTWIPTFQSSGICVSLLNSGHDCFHTVHPSNAVLDPPIDLEMMLTLWALGVHMGKEAKENRFVKLIVDVGHKMGTKNCPGRLYLSRGGNPSTKKGPTKGKAALGEYQVGT